MWFTGLSGSGKSTLSRALAVRLGEVGRRFEVLDGDVVRTNLSKGLGFSREDRDTNVRRIAFVCHLLSRNGVVAISAAISPYAAARQEARALIGDFVEVYVRCPLPELVRRDVKGLYAKALRGEIEHFTGISDPYEEPEHADVVVDSAVEAVDVSLARILHHLALRGYLAEGDVPAPATGSAPAAGSAPATGSAVAARA